MAAIEDAGTMRNQVPKVLFAWPDVKNRRNLYAITLPPPFGSLIDSDSLHRRGNRLTLSFLENWPPVVIPFFSFRIMGGMWSGDAWGSMAW